MLLHACCYPTHEVIPGAMGTPPPIKALEDMKKKLTTQNGEMETLRKKNPRTEGKAEGGGE